MRKLQTGEKPQGAAQPVDPEAPLQRLAPTTYHRSKVIGDHGTANIGAMPSETYQYDIVYEAFCNDKEFWGNWHVIGCERNSATESVSQDNASIRVVMKLSPSQRLYPTAYTPGFPTVPAHARSSPAREPVNIPGLPIGFSVALDVHILEDARVLLEHQRSFRKGSIDTKYDWLDRIVTAHDLKFPPECSRRQMEKPTFQLISGREHRPEATLRAPVGSLPIDCSTPGLSDDLKPFSDLYGDRRKVMQHVGLGSHQVYSENTLVSVFGGSEKIGLPPRDVGRWAEEERKQSPKVPAGQEIDGKTLDARLDALLARTALSEDF